MTVQQATSRPFTGWHMWGLAIAFFGVIIGVNIWLAVVSATSWTGMVVTDPYVAGQQFETNRIAHEAQAAAGWVATFIYAPGVARLVIVDGANKPVDLGDVTVQINRPVGGHDDKTVTLEPSLAGGYEAAVELPSGFWEAVVTAPHTPKGPFTLTSRFHAEETGK
jgi:nitrogen fixation protein FixH